MHKTGVDRMQVPLINGEPHPSLVALADELEAHWKKIVTERDEYAEALREQVEKLTKERDTEIARNRPLQSLIKSTEETKSFLRKKSEENKEAVKQLDSERQANALLTEELAALAEQNELLTRALNYCVSQIVEFEDVPGVAEALRLPNLASPVLNRIRAEGMEMAAGVADALTQASSDPDTRSPAAAWCLWTLDSAKAIRARADELEKSNGL